VGSTVGPAPIYAEGRRSGGAEVANVLCSLFCTSAPLPLRPSAVILTHNVALFTLIGLVKVVIIPLSSKEVISRVINNFGCSPCDSSDLFDRSGFTSNRESRQYCRCFRRWWINGCFRSARSSYGSVAHNVGCGILVLNHFPRSIAYENRYLIHYEESTRTKSSGSAATTAAEDASSAAATSTKSLMIYRRDRGVLTAND